jgi:hypothetical protein
VYVKIPRSTKCGKISHRSMGICAGKFLEIQNICKSLFGTWKMLSGKIKLYRMKLLLNIYTREIGFPFATVYGL